MNPRATVAFDQRDVNLECLLSPQEVAGLLQVSVKTVHKLVREKRLSCVQVTSRGRRFTPEQVQEYIRSQSTEVRRVDKKDPRLVQSPPKKGGIERKSTGEIGTDLVKEIRSLCR